MKGKVILIDFWATWCGPCIKEIPSLIELEKEYYGKDITFVSISFDKDADLQKWKAVPGDELETREDGKKKLHKFKAQ